MLKVWIDINKDGIKQRSESGFAGITVNLYEDKDHDTKIITDVTDEKGYYRFNAMNPDLNYVVEVVAPIGYKFSEQNNPSASAKDFDSDIDPLTGFTASIDVQKGRYFYWIDAALQPIGDLNYNPASVGDKVWLDENIDGIKQNLESGFANVVMNLWLEENNRPTKKLATTKTDDKGNYQFINLNPNLSYYVEIILPDNYTLSVQNNEDASGRDWDSDFDLETRFTKKLRLLEDEHNYWLADAALHKGLPPRDEPSPPCLTPTDCPF